MKQNWFEAFVTKEDGTTETIAQFDTESEALKFAIESDVEVTIDEWQLIDGTPLPIREL